MNPQYYNTPSRVFSGYLAVRIHSNVLQEQCVSFKKVQAQLASNHVDILPGHARMTAILYAAMFLASTL